MLQIIFGDDEHTGAEGTYSRLLKTRKWLYASAIASLLVTSGLYNEGAAADLVKIVKLPTSVISSTLAFGLMYLLIQYLSLIGQLLLTYDIVLSDRFTFRRSEELVSARDRVGEAQKQLQLSLLGFRADNNAAMESRERELSLILDKETSKLKKLENAKNVQKNAGKTGGEMATINYDISRQKAIRARTAASIKSLKQNVSSELKASYDPNVKLAESALTDANAAYGVLKSQVPSERKGYKVAEYVIDLIRVVPPAVVASGALLHFLKFLI